MTAYAQAKSPEVQGLSYVVEIHSVNRKFLDIQMALSKELSSLEIELKKMIAKEVLRGKVHVNIFLKKTKTILSSLPFLKQLKTEWVKTAKELGFSKEEVDLSFLVEQMQTSSFEEFALSEKKVETHLKQTLHKALVAFILMKEAEGKNLATDLKKRLKFLSECIRKIEKQSKESVKKYREKLLTRLKELLKEAELDERIFKEVALFAEKIDISEEITRFRSHLKQLTDLFETKEKSIGRTLDFLVQEMLREMNTISAKSPELKVIQQAVVAKAEIERIREQVQNIE